MWSQIGAPTGGGGGTLLEGTIGVHMIGVAQNAAHLLEFPLIGD